MIDRQRREMTEEEVLTRLTALCAAGEHCQHDMTSKMKRWGIAEEVQAHIMEHLVANRYVDDKRYARAFANDKVLYDKWGPYKIDLALRQKGIDETIRREVLSNIDEQQFLDVLRPLLANKRRSIRAASQYELNGKLIRFATGRGFTIDQVRQCLDGDIDDVD